MKLRKHVFYMSAEMDFINECHFSLFIVGNHERLPAEIKFSAKPTRRQIRKASKFVMNHIKRIQGGV